VATVAEVDRTLGLAYLGVPRRATSVNRLIAIPASFAAQPSEPVLSEAVTNIATFVKLGTKNGLLSPQYFRASTRLPMRQSEI
jgi:hypothetical protein